MKTIQLNYPLLWWFSENMLLFEAVQFNVAAVFSSSFNVTHPTMITIALFLEC